jgi:hypothetical protein
MHIYQMVTRKLQSSIAIFRLVTAMRARGTLGLLATAATAGGHCACPVSGDSAALVLGRAQERRRRDAANHARAKYGQAYPAMAGSAFGLAPITPDTEDREQDFLSSPCPFCMTVAPLAPETQGNPREPRG